jgi:apolipoprotein N-acyltransferase
MINGWVTDLLIQPILIWRADRMTRLPVGSMTTLLVVLGTLLYGSAQRSNRFFEQGPKVAVVQHDFPMYVDDRAGLTTRDTIFRAYLELARKAAMEKPDLIVLPETATSCYINDEFVLAKPEDLDEIRRWRYGVRTTLGAVKELQRFSRQVRDAFQSLSTETGVPIVFGSSSLEWRPKAIPPGVEAFNSAFLLAPGETRPVARYDKIHLVLFGEYVPFRLSHRSLYDWLNKQTPWGQSGLEYSLSPGGDYTVFEFGARSLDGRPYRAAVPICYEEIMPYITRRFVRGAGRSDESKHIDMLLTISNDGWFLHSEELEQHLAAAVFRAVENRIPIARSVNTGASAQIHPNGKIHSLVTLSDENRKKLETVAAALERLSGLAERMADLIESDEAYSKAFEEAGQVYLRDLRGALQAMGPEFEFIAERLGPAMYDLTARTTKGRLEAARKLGRQLGEELDMISRWRDKPWTAPGYIVADMKCDNRLTVYTRWGDWFGQAMVALLVMMLLDWLLHRFWKGRTAKQT